jgi:hypothetical protein
MTPILENRMKLTYRVFITCFIVMAVDGNPARAAQEGESREPSFPIAAEAKAFVGRFDRTELAKDDVFAKVLVELAKSDMPAEAKADAFALMQGTALIVLAQAGPPDHLRDFYKSLGDVAKDKNDIDWLRKFWDSGFRDPLQADPANGSALKIWDGFALKLENGGGTITDGRSFRYWISFK